MMSPMIGVITSNGASTETATFGGEPLIGYCAFLSHTAGDNSTLVPSTSTKPPSASVSTPHITEFEELHGWPLWNVPPCEATRAPSLAAFVMVIWEYISRPKSIAVNSSSNRTGRIRANSARLWPRERSRVRTRWNLGVVMCGISPAVVTVWARKEVPASCPRHLTSDLTRVRGHHDFPTRCRTHVDEEAMVFRRSCPTWRHEETRPLRRPLVLLRLVCRSDDRPRAQRVGRHRADPRGRGRGAHRWRPARDHLVPLEVDQAPNRARLTFSQTDRRRPRRPQYAEAGCPVASGFLLLGLQVSSRRAAHPAGKR